MKKNQIYLVILFIVLFFSCRQTKELPEPDNNLKNKSVTKQSYKPSNYKGVTNNGEYLSFDTREDFENVVKNVENEEELEHFHKIMGHNSRHKNFEISKIEDTLSVDESLNSILNIENMVQIEKHIYKLDLENEKIYALNINNLSDIQALKNKDTTNENIKFFSMEYETLELVDAGLKRNPSQSNEKFFNWFRCSWAGRRTDNANYPYGDGYNLKVILKYQRAGIWFSLVSKFVNRASWLGFMWQNQRGHKMYFDYAHQYHIRCNTVVGYQTGTKYNPTININGALGLSHKIVYRPHSSMRALRSYSFSIIGANATAQVFTRLHKI